MRQIPGIFCHAHSRSSGGSGEPGGSWTDRALPARPPAATRGLLLGCALLLTAACASAPLAVSPGAARAQVLETEAAFARTMADRNPDAFARFIAEDAVFIDAGRVLRGRDQVVGGWAGFFAGPAAPFSWAPESVEVLASGDLALSSGPVHDQQGNLVARFTSIWRRGADGRWRIVFDRGSRVCP